MLIPTFYLLMWLLLGHSILLLTVIFSLSRSLKACKGVLGWNSHLDSHHLRSSSSSTSILTCCCYDDPSYGVPFWCTATTTAAAAAAGPGCTRRQHRFAVSHRPRDSPRHRPQDHGDLPAPQKHAGLCLFAVVTYLPRTVNA